MGRPCEVFRLTDQLGRRELWVTKDLKRLPVRILIYRRDTSRTMTTEYLNLAHGALDRRRLLRAPNRASQLERLDFDSYMQRSATGEPIGPVPGPLHRPVGGTLGSSRPR